MTPKEELSEIRKIDKLIDGMVETLYKLRCKLTNTSPHLSPDKVQTTKDNDRLADTIASIIDFETAINSYIDELIDLKQKSFAIIQRIPNKDYQTILISRYFSYNKWEQIAVDMNFSIQRIYQLHGQALQAYDHQKKIRVN